MSKFSPEEKKVSQQNGLTEAEYLAKRDAFAKKRGKSWEQLVTLTSEDIKAMEQMRIDGDEFLSEKLSDLAKQVSNS